MTTIILIVLATVGFWLTCWLNDRTRVRCMTDEELEMENYWATHEGLPNIYSQEIERRAAGSRESVCDASFAVGE